MATIRKDRFGNDYQLKQLKEKVSKGDVISNVYVGYLEIGGKLFSLEVSPCNKDATNKGQSVNAMWLKVTKKEKRKTSSSW